MEVPDIPTLLFSEFGLCGQLPLCRLLPHMG
jgi:hypothetical protein